MSLVFVITVAIAVFRALCDVMRKIRNFVVHVMGWEPRPRMENRGPRAAEHVPERRRNVRRRGRVYSRKQPIEHDERLD